MNAGSAREAQMTTGADETERALLRILRGDPSPEELAALLAVVSTYAAPGGTAHQDPTVSAWSDPAASLRRPLRTGPAAWVTSGWQSGVRTRPAW